MQLNTIYELSVGRGIKIFVERKIRTDSDFSRRGIYKGGARVNAQMCIISHFYTAKLLLLPFIKPEASNQEKEEVFSTYIAKMKGSFLALKGQQGASIALCIQQCLDQEITTARSAFLRPW